MVSAGRQWTWAAAGFCLIITLGWPIKKTCAFGIFGNNIATFATKTTNYFRKSALRSSPSEAISRELEEEEKEVEHQIQRGQDELQQYFDFPLDDWQLQAGGAILEGYNVIVCAPTGAGKTVVGEMALRVAFTMQQKHAIYTTPLKALSNQKYGDLCPMFGKSNVGLSTGDISIHKGAPITVMTTEVYRNIAWRASSSKAGIVRKQDLLDNRNNLEQNAMCVLDEFHYMGHPGRGGVWEECVITSPLHTQLIGLSATLPNAPQLTAWMEHVTGRKTVLVNTSATKPRPVPLRYLFATKEGLFPLFKDPEAGPGAPKGLLGLRGDGVTTGEDSKQRKRKNKDNDDTDDHNSKLPRGLHINPQLKAAADKRLQKVNRAIDRKKVRQMTQNNRSNTKNDDDDDWEWGRRGRGRKSGPMSPRDEKRERERLLKQELRRSVPSLAVLLKRLHQKNLLPAIFFLFSRAGCDEAARNVCNFMRGPVGDSINDLEDTTNRPQRKRQSRQRGSRRNDNDNNRQSFGNNNLAQDANGRMFRLNGDFVSDDVLEASINDILKEDDIDEEDPLSKDNFKLYAKAGLLSYEQVETVAAKIEAFNQENEEIAFPNGIMMQYLFGVGSHHAGMLPAHKSFVEILFRNQLMRAVFATETLAAGINMPARTTVICALAKRGDGSSMNLLETSNLLQMAGRAGRRGFDENGYCVIVATPFENHDDAAKILTDPIKPITSQFSPSYSLAVNLVARGQGKLDVAKQLVGKSFALWERSQIEEDIATAVETHGEGVSEVLEASAHERFMITLVETLQLQVDKKRARFDVSYVAFLVGILNDRESLKKASKSYLGAVKMLELEKSTLGYLEAELATTNQGDHEDDLLGELFEDDREEVLKQIEFQRSGIAKIEKDINKHPFTKIGNIANELMEDPNCPEGKALLADLRTVRGYESNFGGNEGDGDTRRLALSPEDLCRFSKSAIVIRRKTRKLSTANPGLDPLSLLEQADKAEEPVNDTWDDMLSIIKVLVAYGCLSLKSDLNEHDNLSLEQESFEISPAGNSLGMLGFDNSLWCMTAVGGTWDVVGASSKLDTFRSAIEQADREGGDWYDDDERAQANLSKAQEEAEELVSLIRTMEPSQLAGYVSCLISEGSRNSGGGLSVIDIFQKMEPVQQRVIQSSLQVMERLMDVQKEFDVDENTRVCNFDVSNCDVVTAWASGCSWSEALEISGSPPGDLARTLSRVLDAVRQLANLPYRAMRKSDFERGAVVAGLHPEIRNLCREAALAINRYPVKDPLQFAEIADEEEIEDELLEDEDADVEISDESDEDDENEIKVPEIDED
ncbi:viralicidic activity 2-like 2 [Seminavis robusta]|uniref:Viralicidic activity 2-like 2 n=1 Tax=Seminavis robusta TaxID=568900 RepID=A0A9N8DGE4_9STRA|nr:viralicidic activity 2-like 2 [Seminavis robusta]|eukprot:Sro55_g032450.1 viralicidic activity 2-like 2 (1320) ;mRNA; f:117837-122035